MDHSDDALDFVEWQKELENLLQGKKYHIIFEPGRFIVANSGELITKVLYIKSSGDREIIITDASFSEYLRPALYEINPPVQTLNNSKELKNYDIAGGICESTDKRVEFEKSTICNLLLFSANFSWFYSSNNYIDK